VAAAPADRPYAAAVTDTELDALDEQDDFRVALQRALAVVEVSFERRAQLEHALQSRIVIEQAKGVLAERLKLSVDEAFQVLRRASRSNGLKVHAVARMVVDESETPDIVLEALRNHLARR
jgi:AmiR/NasT family two-component response regulator